MKLTTGSVHRRIFYFALPMLMGNVFQQLYNVINAVVVGKYVGKEALAGVLASSQVAFIVFALIFGVCMGGSIVAAQYYGARDYQKTQQAAHSVMFFLLIASIVTGGTCAVFCRQILELVCVPVEAMPAAEGYLRIFFIGFIGMFGYHAVSSLLRGIGDSKTPFYALIVSCLLNIALDFFFVLGLGMGAEGTAWATIISQTAAWIALLVYTDRKVKLLRFAPFSNKFNFPVFWKCMRIGLPAGLQQTFVSVGMTALLGIVNAFGVDVTAGYGAAMRIDAFIAMPAMNFSAALSTFTGQNIGANHPHRLRKGLFATLWMSGAVSILITLAVIAFKRQLIACFTDVSNVEVINAGASYLTIVCSFYIVFSTLFVVQGFLRGAGSSIAPMLISLVSLWLIRIPIAGALSQNERWGYEGIFWSIPIAWSVGLLMSVIYYLSGKWKKRAVTA